MNPKQPPPVMDSVPPCHRCSVCTHATIRSAKKLLSLLRVHLGHLLLDTYSRLCVCACVSLSVCVWMCAVLFLFIATFTRMSFRTGPGSPAFPKPYSTNPAVSPQHAATPPSAQSPPKKMTAQVHACSGYITSRPATYRRRQQYSAHAHISMPVTRSVLQGNIKRARARERERERGGDGWRMEGGR